MDDINRSRPHVLSEKEEVLLAEADEPIGAISQTFSMLNNADLTFPSITNEDGEEVELTHGRYSTFLESSIGMCVSRPSMQCMTRTAHLKIHLLPH